jgi:geranylgeranyl diphosphate synthase, type I
MEQVLKRYLPRLDATLRQVVDSAPIETPDYAVMLRYPLGWVDANNQPYHQQTGKRIRPILLLLCNEAAGGKWEDALFAAAAAELLHNFSLVHDDIQDNSPMRHGRSTVWKIWGGPNAINAGDALFALAYISLTRLAECGIEPSIMVDCWRIFNSTVLELTRGQHLDMRFENESNVSVDDYISMISGKTAALVACCAEIGALIGSSDHALASRYANFGLNLGIAFQIRDDILGIWGDADVTGKSVATDIVSRKKSLPVLYGLQQNTKLVELYQKETFEEPDVERAVALLDSVNALQFTQQQEAKFYERAIASLNEANPQGEAAVALKALIDRLFERTA